MANWLFFNAVLTVEVMLYRLKYGRMIVNSEIGQIWEKEFVSSFVV
jgi:hypothetical protein